MKQAIEKIRRKFARWLTQQRALRRRKLHVVRLEDRRLPDATFGAALGALTLDGFDGGDSLNVEFDSSANLFHFSLTDGHWDSTCSGDPGFQLSPDGRLLTFSASSLQELRIDATSSASGGLTPLSVTDSTRGIAVGQLTILGAGSVVLDSAANDFDHLAISAERLDLFDSDDVSIQSLDIHHDFTLTAAAAITDTAGTTISVGGHAQIVGSTIVLGDDVADSIHFGSLSFHATGAVSISEADDMVLSGSSTADSLTLYSGGSITDDGTADLHINELAHFDADAIELDDTYSFGSLTASSRSRGISISESDDMSVAEITSAAGIHLSSAGEIHLTADSYVLAGHHTEIMLTASTNITIGDGATIQAEGGNVLMDAGPHGDLFVSGAIDVSDLESGEIGGTVHLLGARVALFDGAIIDASGDTGGGTVLIGGDYQGANVAIHNAARSFVGSEATISADAITTGNGGRVIVWSDNSTEFFGMLSARGGKDGHGGFAEVSGKDLLAFSGSVDLTGELDGGTLLLDPQNITIADTATPDVRTANDAFNENPGSSVTFDADTITTVTNNGTAVVLQASNDITINESIITNRAAGAGGALTLQAGRSVIINANITTDDAALSITANETLAKGVVNANRDSGAASITMASGTTILSGTGNVTMVISTGAGLTNNGSGDLILSSITSSGVVTFTNNGPTAGSDILAASASSLISATTLNLVTVSGTIGDSNQALKFDATTLTANSSTANSGQYLSEANTVAIGTTGLNAGTATVSLTSGNFTLPAAHRINDATTLSIASGASFQMKGFSETIGGLSGSGVVENESNAANTATLTASNAAANTFSGVLRNGDGTGTDGTVALVKSGSGTLLLSGSNTYTGTTTINGGTLQLDGTIDANFTSSATVTVSGTSTRLTGIGTINNAVTVSTGATLDGSLNITGPVTINSTGTLSPGNSPGIVATGNLNLANGSTFTVEITDNNTNNPLVIPPGALAGTDYDQVQVTGSVTIGGTAKLSLQDLGSAGINPRDVYVIINNDGNADAVSGTFGSVIGATDLNGGTLASGDLLDLNGNLFRIFYNGGDGNDVVLIGRPTVLGNVFVSNSFVGLVPGTFIADVDFIAAGNQPGVYGIDGFATVAEGIAGVDLNGVIHVDQGTYFHTGTLAVSRSVTIDGQGLGLTNILKSGAPTGNFDEAIRISADNVTISDAKLGWQVHSTIGANSAVDYKGYVVVTTADNTTISRVLFGSSLTGEGYRSAVVFEGTATNGADGLEVSDSIFEGRWGRGAIRDGDAGSGENFLITRNEFREDHFRWGPIAIGPQDSAGTPNNFAFSGEISFNYFGNGLDAVDFQSGGNQNYTVTITNQGLTAAGLNILHNTFDWNDSTETNTEGNFAQPAGVYITPSLTGNTDQILIQDNIFNNFAYVGPQPGTTDPLWRPDGMFGGSLEFDGADDFGVFQSPLVDIGSAGTLAFWINPADVGSQRHALFNGGGVEVTLRNGAIYFYPDSSESSSLTYAALGSFGANTWTHVAVSWDFATQSTAIYINGTEASYLGAYTPANSSWVTPANTADQLIRVGSDAANPDRIYQGRMDDIGIFDKALLPTEIMSIWASGVSNFVGDPRLIAGWNLDQISGDTAIGAKNNIDLFLTTDGIVPFGPEFRAGQGHFGGALEFDGIDDLATFQDPSFDVGDRGTLNFWVNFDDTGSSNQFFEGPGNAGFEFQYRTNGSGQIYGRTTTAGGDFVIRSGNDAATLNNGDGWHNIQYTWDFTTGELRIYLDGTESSYLTNYKPTDLTWAAVVDTANGIMHMGYDPGSTGQFFDGLMDDVAWYNDVLTQAERDTVRIDGASSHTDLVANWKFDAAPTVDNTYLGDSGTGIVLYLQQLPPSPPVSGYGVVTPIAAVALNNAFFNDVAGEYADSNQVLDPSNLTGPTANPFFKGDDPNVLYAGTTLAEFYRLRWGSSAAFQSTDFQTHIATVIPHIGANQEDPAAFGVEDILVAGTDFDDLVVLTFTSDNDGFFTFTRNVTGASPEFVGSFSFVDITSFTFDGYGGDDVFIIVQPTAAQGGLFSLVNGITFNGDTQNSNGNALGSDGLTGGDTLVLLTSVTDQAVVDSADYVFGNDDPIERHAGTITLTDGLLSTVIAFNGTEPIRDELSVNARTFTFASTIGGGDETIIVSTPGDTVAMNSTTFMGDEIKPQITSRTLDNRIQSTLGPRVSFANSNTQLTINAGIGNDVVNINSIHSGFRSALTINGDVGTDTVNLNTNLTLGNAVVGNTGNLTVTAESINLSAAVAIDTTAEVTGDGDVLLTADSNVILNADSTITTSTGNILATTSDGPIDVDGMITTGSGNVLLMASGSGRNIELDADVVSSSGHITLLAENSVNVGPLVDIQTAGAGTTIIEAAAGSVTMNSSSTVSTVDGGIRVKANSDVTISRVTANNANVNLISILGSILDADGDDSDTDIIALGLRIQAAVGVGTLGLGSNAIESTVTTLSARAGGGGINILESNGLTVNDVTVTTQKVQTDGTTLAVNDAAQSDLVTTNNGSIVLRLQARSLVLDDGTAAADGSAINVNGTGNLLLQTLASNGDVILNARASSGTGNLTIIAGDDVDINADLSTMGAGTAFVLSTNGAADTISGIDMAAGTSITTDGGNVSLSTTGEGDIRLGLINVGSGDVSLIAERDIRNSGVAVNVVANDLRMVADANSSGVPGHLGSIGKSDVQGTRQDTVNREAIGTTVNFVAARAAEGIYIHETNSIEVSRTGNASGNINVNRVNVDSTATLLSDNFQSLEDLTTTSNGPIKLVAEGGTITINGGGDSAGISANGTGDVLVEARGLTSDVIVNAPVQSGTGDVTLNAGRDVDINTSLTTVGGGTIYVRSGRNTDIDAMITTANGDVLVDASSSISQTAQITSTTGDIGLIAGQNITQTATGDITTTTGDVLIKATAGNWTMAGDAAVRANNTEITLGGGDLLGIAGGNITLGVISLTNATGNRVALQAGGSITDANAGFVNIEEAVAASTTSVSLRAGTIIGGAGGTTSTVNTQALDLNVDTVAATSATGIYLREIAAGGAITIDTAAAATVAIDGVRRADFDSSTTDVSTSDSRASLEDLRTTLNGPIKLVAEAGSITINGAADGAGISANGSGDVLLEARGGSSDVIMNATLQSGTGHVTLNGGRDVDLNASLTTGGSGTIYVRSGRNTNNHAVITTANGDVLVDASSSISQTAQITSTNGDVGLIAGQNITQTATGDITTTTGDVLIKATAGNWSMAGDAAVRANNTEIMLGGGDLLGITGGNITLGVISLTNATGNRVALQAGGSITDANAGFVNIEETHSAAATSLSLRAGTIIGGAGGTTSTVNTQALDLNVDTVAATAASGIYLREIAAGGAITVNTAAAVTVSIDGVRRSDFDSSTTDVSTSDTRASLEDLRTTANGPIKLVAEAGTIAINGGTTTPTAGISANGTGDVLLEARGLSSDVIVNASIVNGTGHVTLDGGRHVDVNAAVTTGGTGTMYSVSGMNTDIDAVITTASGDVLISAGGTLSQTSLITSTNGDIGLITGGNITQAVNGDITTTTGDVLVDTGADWTMDGDATITAGGQDVFGRANGNITLGVITLTSATVNRVALQAVNGSITDANLANVNVQETVSGVTTSLSLRAGTIIGGAGGTQSSVNTQALDLNVDTVAASSANGIYLRELASGGAITVNTVAAVTVHINGVVRSDFDSSTTSVAESRTLAALEDLRTSANGPIKLVAEAGTITINGGTTTPAAGISANGSGDVLLEARGLSSDVIVNAAIVSGTGHLTLDGGRHVDVNAAATTGGTGTLYSVSGMNTDIDAVVTTASGDVLISAGGTLSQSAVITSTNGDIGLIAGGNITQAVNGDITTTTGDVLVDTGADWTMDGGAIITAGGQDVFGRAGNNITLGVLSLTNAASNRVALQAVTGSITDANLGSVNIQETVSGATTSVSLRAGTIIGGAGNTTSTTNNQALDLVVDTIAADSASGIYLRELAAGGAIEVNTAAAVTVSIDGVRRSDFDSNTTTVAQSRNLGSLEDLRTSGNGPIKLVAEGGTITINRGTTTPAAGISANGTGDVLVEARGLTSDVIVNATVQSGTGHVTLNAGRDVDINTSLTTVGGGTMYVRSGRNTDIDAMITTANGDVLVDASSSISQTAQINSTTGDIGLIAGQNITQTATGDITTTTGDVLIKATAGNWTMAGHNTTRANNTEITLGGGDFLGIAGGNITLGVISLTNATGNRVALQAGGSITDANAGFVNIEETAAASTTSVSLRAGTIIGGAGGTTSTVNTQALDLNVDTVAATSATGIYLREIAAGGAITIDTAAAATVAIDGVRRADFDSSTTDVSTSDSRASLEDLRTTLNGPIKLVAEAGTITINPGTATSVGVSADGSGDVLLEARGAGSDVVVNGDVLSGTGNVTLEAARKVDINEDLVTAGAGDIYVSALAGQITVGDADTTGIQTASGDILLKAATSVTLNTGLVSTSNGNIGVIAGSDITQNQIVSTLGGDILLNAGGNLVQAATSSTTTGAGSGNILLKATTHISVHAINAGSGNVSIEAGGNISDRDAGTTVDIRATNLKLMAGGIIGASDLGNLTLLTANVNAIDTAVTTLAAQSVNGIYIQEADAVTIGTVGSLRVTVTATRADFDSSTTDIVAARTADVLSDLTTTSNGPVKLVTVNGSITATGGGDAIAVNAHGTGNVLLDANGTGNDLTLLANVLSGSGHITLNAADQINIGQTLTSVLVQTAAAGTIFVQADSGSVVMQKDSVLRTANGNIHVQANIDVIVGRIEAVSTNVVPAATDSHVAITTVTGSILDADVAGDSTVDITAQGLRLNSALSIGTIGTGANALETSVATVSARATAGGMNIVETNGVVVDDVIVVTQRVNFNSTTTTITDATQSDLATTGSNGSIVLRTLAGNITLNDGTSSGGGNAVSANGNGNVLIAAEGSGTIIIANADVRSGTGNISLLAALNVNLNAAVDVVTTGTGTIDVLATAGALTMHSTATLQAVNGDIRTLAAGNVIIGDITASSANVSLTSTAASILDADPIDDSDNDVTSLGLRMNAAIGVGTLGAGTANSIETNVNTVSAHATSGGIYILEAKGVTVDAVTVSIHRVAVNALTSDITDALQSDLTTTSGDGSIVLRTTQGNITLNDGAAPAVGSHNGTAVSANGRGSVLLDAADDVEINANVLSGTGHITVVVGDDVDQNADILTIGGSILVSAANGTADAISGIDMQSGTKTSTGSTTGGNIILLSTGESDVKLGLLEGGTGLVSIEAERNILDDNDQTTAGTLNITAAILRIVADSNGNSTGIIGGSATGNGTPSANVNAIDISVNTIAARSATGIYLQEFNAIEVNATGAIAVSQVTSNGTTSFLSRGSLEDLTTTSNGPIKLQSVTGTVTVNAGTVNTAGITAHGSGSVLLQTLANNGDVIVNASIVSGIGHITLNAGDDIDLKAGLNAGLGGTVYLLAANGTVGDVTGPEVDGININGSITTVNGDVLVESLLDIRQTALISSTNGDIGLIAAQDVLQNDGGDITTTTGDGLVEAGRNWTMTTGTVIAVGGGEFDGKAVSGNLALGRINAANVALTANVNISDANGATLNVDGVTLSLRAGGLIGNHDNANGTPSMNANAIDTRVSTLAASAGTGLYIEEANGLTIGTVAAVSVNVNLPQQVNFNGTLTAVDESRGTLALEDLRTTNNGPIKVVAAAGSITVNAGTAGPSSVAANGTGDVLLEARGTGSDVILNSDVRSGTGDITLIAARSVVIGDDVSTAGGGRVFVLANAGSITVNNADGNLTGISTQNGDILLKSATDITLNGDLQSAGDIGVKAGNDLLQNSGVTTGGDVLMTANQDITMAGSAITSANGGELLYDAGRNINVGLVQATNVSLNAGGDITDSRRDLITNIRATNLRMVAGGAIGDSDSGSAASVNTRAIDTEVVNLAAASANGTHIQEVAAGGSVIVRDIAAVTVTVSVDQAKFNSTSRTVTETTTLSGLADLATTSNGDIKLVAANGSITIQDGPTGVTNASNQIGVSAHGTGDVLLEARGNGSDVVVNANILSGVGHITLNAGDDIDLNSALSTGGTGTVYLLASNGSSDLSGVEVDGINLDAGITTADGDVLIHSMRDIRQTSSVTSGSGDVGLIAGRNIEQTATGHITTTTGDVLVDAGGDWTMAGDATITAGGQDVLGQAAGTIRLGVISLTNASINRAAFSAGGSILDVNGAGVNIQETNNAATTSLSLRAGSGMIGQAGEAIESVNSNAIDLNVDTVAARAVNGIYLRQLTAGGPIEVNTAAAVTVNINGVVRSDFDSGTTSVAQSRTLGSLEDLTTTANGPIELLAEAGTITIYGGADTAGISANGIGDVLLEARGDNSDVIVNADVVSGGGDIVVRAERDLIVRQDILSANGLEDSTAATGESILLESMNGNVTIDATSGPIRISTDENPGRSNAVTGDRVFIVADVNNSIQNDEVKFIGDVTLSTDGGVATNFAPRPAVGRPSTAYFVYSSNPLPLAVDAVPTTVNGVNAYLYGFNVLIGVVGEENLTVDVDWQDPVNEPGVIANAAVQSAAVGTGIANAVSSERIQQFLVGSGGQVNTVGHVYTTLDFTVFQSIQNRTTIIVDLSVSHHSSLNVTGSVIEQFGVSQVVPGREITSTDNVLTGNNQFEGGLASFRIPTVTTAPLAFFYTESSFATDRPIITAAFESNTGNTQQVVADFGSGAAGGSASSTDVYFQIRRQYESDRPAETVVERISDSRLISSREAFEEYVRQNAELQDGAGYEIWLISETGGQKVERPIVEFEITGGQPGPASDALPESLEPPRLQDLPFEQPAEDNNAAVEESPQALFVPKSDVVIGSISPSDISTSDVSHAAAENGIVDTAGNENSWSLNDVAVAVSQFAAPTGTIMSVAVSRFRGRVRESGADDRKLTRAARFVRRHS